MDRSTPNFVWKGANALIDYGLIIESELPEIVAKPRYNEITIVGSNRVLNEWFGDYEPFDFKIKDVSVSYERLSEVKRWLSGKSELITHNNENLYVNSLFNERVISGASAQSNRGMPFSDKSFGTFS